MASVKGPEAFFEEQLDQLLRFFVDPEHSILRLVIDPEMRRVPLRYLQHQDQQHDFPHVLISQSEPFDTPYRWNSALLENLDKQISENAEQLETLGTDTAPRRTSPAEGRRPWRRFLGRAERLAQSLPDHIGSLVFVIESEVIGDPKNWLRNIRYFADRTTSQWLKFVVIEERLEPTLEELADHPNVKTQLFWLSAEEIEKRSDAVLAGDKTGKVKADPAVARRALATVGIMATARKDYSKAESAQRKLVKEARASKDPVEIATALYNLGTTYISAGRPERAVEVLTRAADGCCYHKLDQLAPMVYTNLGVALHRAGETDSSFECLRVARDMFRAQRNIPGEAYVCDCLALLNLEVDKRTEAEKAWRFALKLYESITNPAMEDVKQSGRDDILEKLRHHGYANAG